MNAKLFNASLLTACVVLASASQANASGYTYIDLNYVYYSSHANAINNSDQVVGQSTIFGDNNHATIWNGIS